MESFFASLKTERVHEARFRTRAEARAAVFEYIEVFYNRQRLHSALGYRTVSGARPAEWLRHARQVLPCVAAVQRWLRSSGCQSVPYGLPVPGQQLIKSVDR